MGTTAYRRPVQGRRQRRRDHAAQRGAARPSAGRDASRTRCRRRQRRRDVARGWETLPNVVQLPRGPAGGRARMQLGRPANSNRVPAAAVKGRREWRPSEGNGAPIPMRALALVALLAFGCAWTWPSRLGDATHTRAREIYGVVSLTGAFRETVTGHPRDQWRPQSRIGDGGGMKRCSARSEGRGALGRLLPYIHDRVLYISPASAKPASGTRASTGPRRPKSGTLTVLPLPLHGPC